MAHLPNVVGTQTRSGKAERMQQLSPLFERGIVYINKDMIDFIQEYNNFNYLSSVPDVDLLDSFEIAIREELPKYGIYGAKPIDFSNLRVSQSSGYVPPRIAHFLEHAVKKSISPLRLRPNVKKWRR